MINRLLEKEPTRRISIVDALQHRWFKIEDEGKHIFDKRIIQRFKEFRAPKRLQMETLTFLVNNLNNDIDFKSLREAFFTFDKNNVGMLTVNELKEALIESALSKD